MREDAYRAHPGLGGSGLRLLVDDPEAWLVKQETQRLNVQTPAMRFGTAVHTLTLGEGAPVCVSAWQDWRTRAARAAREACEADGGVMLSRTEYAAAEACSDAALELLPDAFEAEVPLYWDEGGVSCKGQLDAYAAGVLYDLKTTGDFDGFEYKASQFGYDLQMAHYASGLRHNFIPCDEAVLIYVESRAPWRVGVKRYTAFELDLAEDERQVALNNYKRVMGNE